MVDTVGTNAVDGKLTIVSIRDELADASREHKGSRSNSDLKSNLNGTNS